MLEVASGRPGEDCEQYVFAPDNILPFAPRTVEKRVWAMPAQSCPEEIGRSNKGAVKVDDLSENELEQIRRFIEEGDELSEELHALVEKYWPSLLEHAPPRVTH